MAALGRLPHTMPQPPQFLGLVVVEVSQPLAGSLSQSAKSALHCDAHLPATQLTMLLGAFLHGVSHEPQ